VRHGRELSVLKVPLSSIVIALLVTKAGPTVAPLVIVGVVVAYIATQVLAARGGTDVPAAREAVPPH